MRLVGWLLDVHVRGGEAVLWLKLGDGWRRYDGEAYVELVLDAAETLLGSSAWTGRASPGGAADDARRGDR